MIEENREVNNDLASFQRLPVNQYGGDPVDFVDFMTDYYMYASAYGWSDKIMIQRLPLYLKGAAREAFNQIDKRTVVEWSRIKDALAEKLISGDIGRILRKKFYSRVQNSNESVSEFAFHLSTLAEKAFGEKKKWTEQTNKLVEDQFWSGIQSHLKAALSLVEYENFDELVKKAMRIEMNSNIGQARPVFTTEMKSFERPSKSIIKRSESEDESDGYVSPRMQRSQQPDDNRRTRNQYFQNNNKNNANRSPTFTRSNNFQQNDRPRFRNDQKQFDQRIPRCYNCNKVGHLSNQCWFKQQSNPPNIKTCFNCGKQGHTSNVCRFKTRSITPSPQRDKVNLKGQIQCDRCKKYGHVARSCRSNIKQSSPSILKKQIKFQDKPVDVGCVSSDEDSTNAMKYEFDELKTQFDRLSARVEETSNKTSMVKGLKIKSIKRKSDQSNVEEIKKKQSCSKIDDLKLDKLRISINRLSNQIDLNKESTSKVYNYAAKIAGMEVTTEKTANLLKLLSNYLHDNDNSKNKIKLLMKNLGKELRQILIFEKLEIMINSCGREVTMVDLSPQSKVNDLKELIISKMEVENFILIFNNQVLEHDEYLIDYGILPSYINNVEVKIQEKDIEKKYELETEMRIKDVALRLINEFKCDYHDGEYIISLLKEIDTFTVSERLIHLIKPLLVAQIHKNTKFRSNIRDLLKKFSKYLRKENLNVSKIFLALNIPDNSIVHVAEHWCIKVKKLKEKVKRILDNSGSIKLFYRNQELEDEDYVYDYGILDGEINQIQVIFMGKYINDYDKNLMDNNVMRNTN